MPYQYRMIQIPPSVMVGAGKGKGDEAARYLEEITNREAGEGWEFQRVDTMTVLEPPGCLGGGQPKATAVYVMTFRRER